MRGHIARKWMVRYLDVQGSCSGGKAWDATHWEKLHKKLIKNGKKNMNIGMLVALAKNSGLVAYLMGGYLSMRALFIFLKRIADPRRI